MNMRRFIQAGAIWGWPVTANPLQEARDRYTVTGNPTVSRGPWGNALTLDGANDYFTLTMGWEDQLRFDAGTLDFSVVAWVRRAATGAWHVITSKLDAGDDGWTLVCTNDDRLLGQIDTIDVWSAAGALADTLWHLVAFVVDRSGNGQLYVDGVASGAAVAIGGEVMATTTAPRIGAHSHDAASKFNGSIAGIFIIPRVLSPAECLGLATGRAF